MNSVIIAPGSKNNAAAHIHKMSRYCLALVVSCFALGFMAVNLGAEEITYPHHFQYDGNPLVRTHGAADPDAQVWDDTVWVYTSQDHGEGYAGMDGYHAFSSKDMVNWTDHGEILHSRDVSWGLEVGGFMWAPCAARAKGPDGKYTYYLYFPHHDKNGKWKIGVAVADSPEGPFEDIGRYIENTSGIDPSVLIDDDGQAYMYFDHNKVARLKPNMTEFAEEPRRVFFDHPAIDTNSHLKASEGPYIHKRNGIYYFSFTNLPNKAGYKAIYSMSDNPYGPFVWKGPFAKRAQGAQNHHSIIEFKGQDYFFYHVALPDIPKVKDGQDRIACFDKLYYNPDGTIQMVERTLGPKDSLMVKKPENGYFTMNPPGGSYDTGTEVTITAKPNLGYAFAGWGSGIDSEDNPLTIVMDGDRDLSMTFEPSPTQMLSTHSENGYIRMRSALGRFDGKVTPGIGVFNRGTQVLLEPEPAFGFQFDRWSGDYTGSEVPARVTVDDDLQVTAHFVEVPVYRLSLEAEHATFKVTPAAQRYEAGATVTIEAIRDYGYAFEGWTGDLSGTDAEVTLVMDADKRIAAEFKYVGDGNPVAFATNAGGEAFKSADGVRYVDDAFIGGGTFRTANDIDKTEDNALFQRYRAASSFSADIPLPAGEYLVTLQFAETFFGAKGNRIFDVSIEGMQAIDDLDLAAEVGKNVAFEPTFEAAVTDGTLNIQFDASKDNALISAIKVIRKMP